MTTMSDRDRRLWAKAEWLARQAMGKTEGRRGSPPEWRANLDPLAWWCLTEAIMDFAASRRAKQ